MNRQAISELLGKALVDPGLAQRLTEAPAEAARALNLTVSEAELELLRELEGPWIAAIAAWISGAESAPANAESKQREALAHKLPVARTTFASAGLASRPLYFDGIREVIREGDLSQMKRVLEEANELLRTQEQLRSAARVLEEAIQLQESRR